MKHIVTSLVLTAALGVGLASSVQAQRLALHVKGYNVNDICTKRAPAGACDTYADAAAAGTPGAPTTYMLYLVAVADVVANPELNGGIRGCAFGIQYEPYVSPGGIQTGLLVEDWTLCASLTFASQTPEWPESNSEAAVTWLTCQTTESVQNNVQSILGALKVTSYSPASLYIIPRVGYDVLEMAGCEPPSGGAFIGIPRNQAGFVTFSSMGEQGCNPCIDAECIGVAAESRTWGRVKEKWSR